MATLKNVTLVALVLVALSIFAPPTAAPAQAQMIPVTACGQTLSAPGKYQLNNDIGPCPGNGVNITSSNVTFDLQDFTISGDPAVCSVNITYDGINVSGPVSGVKIMHGSISGFNDGVDLSFVTDSSVNGVVITNACFFGVTVGNSQKVTVSGNTINSAGLDGVEIGGSSTQVAVKGNTIRFNGRFGVLVETDRNKIMGNKINDNGTEDVGGGVDIHVGERNKIKGNTISVNAPFGVLLRTNRSVVSNNTINGNTQVGVTVGVLGAGKNKIKGVTATGNGVVDLQDVNPACGTNTWSGNTFVTDEVAGAPDGGPGAGCIR